MIPPPVSSDADPIVAEQPRKRWRFGGFAEQYRHAMNDSVWAVVDEASDWLAETNGTTDTELSFQLLKLSEEAGEVANAWIGLHGRNPRKGVTHSRDEVAAELADVAITAMVALRGLGYDPQTVLNDKAGTIATRYR